MHILPKKLRSVIKHRRQMQESVLEAFDISTYYEYPAALIDAYESVVEDKFENHPLVL